MMKFKRIASALVSAAMLLCSAGSLPAELLFGQGTAVYAANTASAVWDGSSDTSWYDTAKNTFEITTAEQLNGLKGLVKSGESMKGKTIVLGNDILLNDTSDFEEWSNTNKPANDWSCIGTPDDPFCGTFDGNGHTISGMYTYNNELFSTISKEGTIKDLNMDKCYSRHIILCHQNNGLIENVNITNSVVAQDNIVANQNFHAGIAGANIGTIKNCSFDGDISGSGLAGGICSLNYGTISDCVNYGSVMAVSGIEKNDNDGSESIEHPISGGIVASTLKVSLNSLVKSCSNYGKIDAYSDYAIYSGGIIGECGSISNLAEEIWFEDLHNYGEVTSSNKNNYSLSGGIIGINTMDALYIRECSNEGYIHSSGQAAGIIPATVDYYKILNVSNTGKIEGGYAGGITASLIIPASERSGIILNAYNTGSITATERSNYSSLAGGIAASVDKYTTVKNVYNTGKINGCSDSLTGAIVGKDSEETTYMNCYYLNTSASEGISGGDKSEVKAMTDKQMKASSFADNMGIFFEYDSGSYPKLIAIKDHVHRFTTTVQKAATCSEEGVMLYTCDCGYSYTKPIETTKHSIVDTVYPARLGQPGYTLHKCRNCTYSYKDTYTKFYFPIKDTTITIPFTSCQYTGNAITFDNQIVVMHGSKQLVRNKQYTVSYKNNKQPGKASVTITGVKDEDYDGSVTLNFVIIPNAGTLSLSTSNGAFKASWTKNSSASGYEIVYSKDKDFKSGVNTYNVSKNTTTSTNFSSKPKAGETWYVKYRAYVTLNGTRYGNYSSVKSITVKGNVKTVTPQYSSYTYSGKAIKPSVTVKDSKGNKLTASDYTVTYSNNTKVGKATIKVTGKGKYQGSVSTTFVVKPKPGTLTLTTTKGAFKAAWTKNSSATGYEIVYSKDKNFKSGVTTYNVSKNTTTSVNFSSKPKSGETWYVKYRAYVTVSGTKYGNFSAVKSIKIK